MKHYSCITFLNMYEKIITYSRARMVKMRHQRNKVIQNINDFLSNLICTHVKCVELKYLVQFLVNGFQLVIDLGLSRVQLSNKNNKQLP